MILGRTAKNHPQDVKRRGACDVTDERRTKLSFFQELNQEYRFTLDAAASRSNTLCVSYFDKEVDGLKQSWAGQTVYVNPPYSNCRAWVEKAFEEFRLGATIVMLLPANRTEQGWWQDLIEPVRDRGEGVRTRFLRGRMRFDWPKGWERPVKGDRPPFGHVVLYFDAWL